ncbi:hypothetical protein ABZP36_034967 [Zizania latifolia]
MGAAALDARSQSMGAAGRAKVDGGDARCEESGMGAAGRAKVGGYGARWEELGARQRHLSMTVLVSSGCGAVLVSGEVGGWGRWGERRLAAAALDARSWGRGGGT